jgi:hypothetical protein
MIKSDVDDASSLQAEGGSSGNAEVNATDSDMFRSFLTRLALYARITHGDEWEKQQAKELPGFPFDISFVQFMILNCRLFGMSQIRCSEYPMTLISIHDFVLHAWQHTRVSIGLSGTVNTAVRYLDLRSRELRTMMETPVKREGCLRVVVISDTHNVGFKFVE